MEIWNSVVLIDNVSVSVSVVVVPGGLFVMGIWMVGSVVLTVVVTGMSPFTMSICMVSIVIPLSVVLRSEVSVVMV